MNIDTGTRRLGATVGGPDALARFVDAAHRSRLAMYTELLRVRREYRVLTDPAARQHLSIVGDTLFVVRSAPGATASLVFNFCDDTIEHPAPDPAAAVVFDSEDPRWRGDGLGTPDPATIPPWSARLSIT